jgi:uncharacterized membrane protein YkvA (DUF1232 family)
MLFKLLNKTCTKISELNIEREAPLMVKEINRARPDFRARLREGGVKKNVIGLVCQAIASGVLVHIKEMPTIVDIMVDRVQNRRSDPATRCALVGVLAYLVQPQDLIPDDAPGGYGYVDDNALLRAGLIEYLDILPPQATEAEKQREYLQVFGSIVPLDVLPALQAAVMGVTSAFHILRMLPPEIIEMTTQQAIANPLQMTAPQPPPDFTPPMAPSLGGGHWSGGAYFEGNDVIMPGGPSLIDGQLFIPD